jgi:ABC-type Zn uptake system ZnuABC Zn-binding protein ZnuA
MRFGIAGLLALVLVVAGCATNGGAGGGRLKVVATTTQLGSVASELGGDDIALTVLLSPGAEAHDYEMTPAAAGAVEDAELLLRSGAGLEGWLDEALETIGGADVTRDMSAGIELREPAMPDVHGDEEGGEAHEVDPHYWLSAPNAIRMVQNVRDALAQADPENASSYSDRAETLVGRLENADTEIRGLMSEIPEERRGIVTNHDALGYFIHEYGLRFVGSVFRSLDVAAEPSPAELAQLIETVRAEGVVAIFSESAVNPELARAVAEETGAHVVDEPLYTDSMGPPGSGGETLDGMLLHNANVIHDALIGG